MHHKPSFWLIIISFVILLTSCKKDNSNKNESIIKDSIQQKIPLTSQELFEQYMSWDESKNFKTINNEHDLLPKLESTRDSILIKEFIGEYFDSLNVYIGKDPELFEDYKTSMSEYLYTLDLNGDKLLDVVYQGPTGGEPYVIQIFINQGYKFIRAFTGYQYLIAAEFSNNRLISLTLENQGCCADPQIVEYTYSITFNDQFPIFKLTRTIGYLRGTQLPTIDIKPGKEFTLSRDSIKLRLETYVYDGEHPVWESEGNVLAYFGKGSEGILLGTHTENSTKWAFVLMKTSPIKCEWSTFNEQPTELKGWIQAELINEE